jgi:hypothetical protein
VVSALIRRSNSAAFGEGSVTTLVSLLPPMIAAIFADVRSATARIGSSFKMGVPLGGSGLTVSEHLANEIEAVAA